MNCIKLTLKLGHCIVDFYGVLNNWNAFRKMSIKALRNLHENFPLK